MKRIISLGMVFLLVVLTPLAGVAEDVYYLENEIRETEAKYKIVHTDLARMDNFLKSYDNMSGALNKALDDLNDLDQKMKSILQKNLIKSTLKLGLETYSKTTLVLGFAAQSVKTIIVACAVEYASDQMQTSFSSTYARVVSGLSKETTSVAPELEEVQKTLEMDAIDVKIKVMRGGEDPEELGETGLIYRKFYYVQEAIEKAKKKLSELSKTLSKTKEEMEKAVPDVKEEDERLLKRLNELKERLNKAQKEIADKKSEEIKSDAEQKGKISASPAPVSYADEEARQALIAQYQSQFTGIIKKNRAELEKIGQDFTNAATKASGLDNYNPFQNIDVSSPLPDPLSDKEIKGDHPQALQNAVKFYQFQVDLKKKLKPVVDEYVKAYEAFLPSFKSEITPVISVLWGLGARPDLFEVEHITNSVAAQTIILPQVSDRMEKETEIYSKNIDKLKAEFDREAVQAATFSTEFSTEAANTINTVTFAIDKAKAAIKNAESCGFKNRGVASNYFSNEIRSEAGKMLAEGKTGAEVRSFLEKQRDKFMGVYEPAAKVA
ncbi:MAG: hypothetical protein PHW46_03855, partial [Candidatus Omnitrophica bacterium]|nr:hypothetical protein [Candidatus Omnitrophota bacterium]